MPSEKKLLFKKELAKYDYVPIYLYTEKDSLNRITILKEAGRESYLVAGRYAGFNDQARIYAALSDEERKEIEKLLKIRSKDSAVSFL